MVAPVNEPFSYPKSSLSKRFSGIEAQLTRTKGLSCLVLLLCTALAINSLPVPLSPLIKIVEVVFDFFSHIYRISFRVLLEPMILLKDELLEICLKNSSL